MTSRWDLWLVELWKVHSVQLISKMCTDAFEPGRSRLTVEPLVDFSHVQPALWQTGLTSCFVCDCVLRSILIRDSPGTTAGSTWDHQTAYPPGSPCTSQGAPACCDASRTAALPTAPAHRQEVETLVFESETRQSETRRWLRASTHPIILWQAPGDVFGASFHSARMIAVSEQEMVLQGPNLRRGRQAEYFNRKWHNSSHLDAGACRSGLETLLSLTKSCRNSDSKTSPQCYAYVLSVRQCTVLVVK